MVMTMAMVGGWSLRSGIGLFTVGLYPVFCFFVFVCLSCSPSLPPRFLACVLVPCSSVSFLSRSLPALFTNMNIHFMQIKGTESPITRIFEGKFRSTLRAPRQKDLVLGDWRGWIFRFVMDSSFFFKKKKIALALFLVFLALGFFLFCFFFSLFG